MWEAFTIAMSTTIIMIVSNWTLKLYEFSRGSGEHKFGRGLFPREKRLAAVGGEGGLCAATTQSVNLTPFCKELTTDGTDGTDENRAFRNNFQSVKSVKSVVQCLCMRLYRAAISALQSGGITLARPDPQFTVLRGKSKVRGMIVKGMEKRVVMHQ